MTATVENTATPSAAPSTGGHSPVLSARDEYFARVSSPATIAESLLESLREGADLSGRAHSILIAGESLLEDEPNGLVPLSLMTSAGELLGDAEWRYTIEAGLKRIAELDDARAAAAAAAQSSATAPAAPRASSADYPETWHAVMLEDDYSELGLRLGRARNILELLTHALQSSKHLPALTTVDALVEECDTLLSRAHLVDPARTRGPDVPAQITGTRNEAPGADDEANDTPAKQAAELLADIGEEVTALRDLVGQSTHGNLDSDTLMVAGETITASTLRHVDAALALLGESVIGGFSDRLRRGPA